MRYWIHNQYVKKNRRRLLLPSIIRPQCAPLLRPARRLSFHRAGKAPGGRAGYLYFLIKTYN